MKYVTGCLKLGPGKRNEFMPLAQPFIANTLKEDGSPNRQRALKFQKWIT